MYLDRQLGKGAGERGSWGGGVGSKRERWREREREREGESELASSKWKNFLL